MSVAVLSVHTPTTAEGRSFQTQTPWPSQPALATCFLTGLGNLCQHTPPHNRTDLPDHGPPCPPTWDFAIGEPPDLSICRTWQPGKYPACTCWSVAGSGTPAGAPSFCWYGLTSHKIASHRLSEAMESLLAVSVCLFMPCWAYCRKCHTHLGPKARKVAVTCSLTLG